MSLKVWLPLNGNLTQQGASNASITNTSATINTAGKIGSCYQFGTGTSYLKFNNMDFIHDFTECSVSLWIKILSWNTSYATYFQFGKGSTPWAHYIFGLLRNNAASTLCFTISNGSSATNANCLTPALDLNTWYHLTFTYADGHCKIYVNGIETKDYSTTIVPNFAGITTGTIGIANNLTGYQTNCLINDFRVYDHCLSAAEVKEISQGLVLHYKLDSIGPSMGNPNLLLDGMTPTAAGNGATGVVRSIEDGVQKVVADNPNSNWCTFGNHNTTLALTKGDTFTFSLMIRSPDSNKKPTVYFQSGLGYYGMQGTMSSNWSIIYYTGTWSIDNLQTNIHLGFSSAPGTYYIKYFKLEKGNTVTPWAPKEGEPLSNLKYIEDSSGYNHNGTIMNTINISFNTPRYSASSFFSNSSCIKLTNFNLSTNIWTTVCWYYRNTNPSAYEALFCLSKDNGSDANKKIAAIPNTSRIWFKGESGSTSISQLKISTWTMLSMVCDGTTVKIYENNNIIGTFSAGTALTGCTDLVIGARAGSANVASIAVPYTGGISDFRIYCTALSAADILQLYHTSAKIDNKKNLHTYELIENSPSIKINKRGQTLCNELQEGTTMKFYKTDSIIETHVLNEF